MTSPETQIASFFAQYHTAPAKLGKAVRARLRERLRGLRELVYVYARRRSLVFSYSPTEAGSQAVCALALDPRGVHPFFAGGARLAPSDPGGLLQGRGKTVRHVVLRSMADFDRAQIERLMAAALSLAKVRLDPAAQGSGTTLKAEAQERRARRVRKAARATANRPMAKPASG